MKLRPYQEKGVTDIREQFKKGYKAPLYVCPTGGGKTVVFCYIANGAAAKNKRVYILVHRVELLRQTSKALYLNDTRHGLVNPKYTGNPVENVQVASVQTLVKRMKKLPAPDIIVIDEGHHATAPQWRQIFEFWPKALLVGVTATAIRTDGKGLGRDFGGIYDSLVIGPQIGELIKLGYLCKPVVFAPRRKLDLAGIKTIAGDYDKKKLAELVDEREITGSAVEHYTRLCPGVPAVAFCISITHAQHVAQEFRDAGYTAEHVDGKMIDEERTRILNGLADGTINVVTSCDIISEGTDIPAVTCGILLRPTKSTGLYIQQVGRVLRPAPGKTNAIILDHAGNVFAHGLPDEPREWSLEGIVKKKKKKGDKEDPKVKQCDKCYAIHEPAPACPVCGHTYEKAKRSNTPNQVEGDLEEITETAKMMLQKAKAQEVGRAKTLEELEAIGRARGYLPGWARKVWNGRNKKVLNL